MNIVFVQSNATTSKMINSAWRGILLFDSLSKLGLHNVALLGCDAFCQNTKEAKFICNNSQIIVIEGSPEIDLLTTIHYWKSRGKKVVVDIPLQSESRWQYLIPKSEGLFSISQLYTNYRSNESKVIDQTEKFRWGLHLADCIFVSSQVQEEQWSATAPVRVIPEFIDLEAIRDKTKSKNDSFVIAIASNTCATDEFLDSVINRITQKYPQTTWLNASYPNNNLRLEREINSSNLPSGYSLQWPEYLPIVDLGIFWDTQVLRGAYYRTILEFMGLHKPWILNDARGYQDLSKYGLIMHNHMNWDEVLDDMIKMSIMKHTDSDEGYIYAIGQNNEDHLHEVLTAFSEILKIE